jgi:hypothetical protein
LARKRAENGKFTGAPNGAPGKSAQERRRPMVEIPEEILREMQEDEEAEKEEEQAARIAKSEGMILYQEAREIVNKRPDLDPGGDMPEWGILEPKKFFIWALLSILFVANGDEDLRVKVKDDLKPFADWYSRASEFEQSEAWELFKD